MNFGSGYTINHPIGEPVPAGGPIALPGSRPAILLVDDEEAILLSLRETLADQGYEVQTESDPLRAVQILEQRRFAVIISDQRMPHISGLELLAAARRLQPDATRILITALLSLDTVIDAINKGEIYRFLVKPWLREELLASVRNAVERHQSAVLSRARETETRNENLRLQEKLQAAGRQHREATARNQALEQNLLDSIRLCTRALDLFLPSLGCQARRAHELCRAMSEILSLPPEQKEVLEIASWLHDAGLLELPRELVTRWLTHNGPLSVSELESIRRHPVVGEDLARFEPPLAEVGRVIRAHHERYDGKGYPDALAGEEIPWLGRLLAVAVFCAGSDETPAFCTQLIQGESGAAFDPEAVRVFIRALPNATLPRKESEVPLASLRPGMKLARGVYANDGRMLIPEGQCLTYSCINKVMAEHRETPIDQVFLVYC